MLSVSATIGLPLRGCSCEADRQLRSNPSATSGFPPCGLARVSAPSGQVQREGFRVNDLPSASKVQATMGPYSQSPANLVALALVSARLDFDPLLLRLLRFR